MPPPPELATALGHASRRKGPASQPRATPPGSEQSGPPPAIAVRDLTVAYRSAPVLWDIHLAVRPGRLTAIVGPNGAGKSTLLKAICGLVRPASGEIQIHGAPLAKRKRALGYVPQRETVDWDFPIRVQEVVEMGRYARLGWFRRIRKQDRDAAREALDKVGLADLAHRQISELSGGQQQRVFLARALAQDAEIYLMDEPFAGVDATTEHRMLAILQDLRDQGRTVVVVHHALQTVRAYFDDVLLINTRLLGSGSVEDAFTDAAIERCFGGRPRLLDAAIQSLRGQ